MPTARATRFAAIHAPVAQLDRASDFESAGRRFDPCRARSVTFGISSSYEAPPLNAPSFHPLQLPLGCH